MGRGEKYGERVQPLGIKGIGGIGTVVPAIANAARHADGARRRDLPVRPDGVLSRLR